MVGRRAGAGAGRDSGLLQLLQRGGGEGLTLLSPSTMAQSPPIHAMGRGGCGRQTPSVFPFVFTLRGGVRHSVQA